jgi:hypothetical protein
MDADVVERLLVKLRRFLADELDEDERVALAALLAPGVAAAYGESEVTGFGTTELTPLSELLARVLRRSGVRVVGLDEPAENPDDQERGADESAAP